MRNIYMTDDLEDIRQQVETFVQREVVPSADQWEIDGLIPRALLEKMGSLGMFSLRVPEERGGLGMGEIASVVFAEALATSTYAGFEITALVHTDLAMPHLLRSGTSEQLDRVLPAVMSGETIMALAITEPDAGSDVAGLRTSAVKDGDGYRINGSKLYITNGVHGDLIVLAARTDPAERYGLSMFLVEADREGFSVSKKLDKHGWRSSDTAELSFTDCWIPQENLLGTEHRGFYEIMKNFQNERLILGAMAVGAAQKGIELALQWTQQRAAFGGTLYDKQTIRHRLAMHQAHVDAGRAALYHAAWLAESGVDATKEVSAMKAFTGEMVNSVLYDCLQFHGGMGYMRESPIERMVRDARILSIGGGATEVMLEEVAKRSIL